MKNFVKVEGKEFFETATGKKYVPVGVNWFARGSGWAPQIWKLFDEKWFERDFSRIKALGMNTIRVFLGINGLMGEEMCVNEKELEKCIKLLDYAKEYGLRVIYSGPNAWEGIPIWMKELVQNGGYFENECFLKSLEHFYHVAGEAFGEHEGFFGYDLFNEPMIRFSPDYDGLSIEKFHEKRQKISYDFTKLCVDAIRKHDKAHLISVGSHQWTVPFCGQHPSHYFCFDPHAIGELVDYVSLHWYPYLDKDIVEGDRETFEYNAAFLHGAMQYMDVGKPVVLEEFGLYGGGPAHLGTRQYAPLSQKTQADWVIDVAMKRGSKFCDGWLNWGFDDYEDQGDPTRYQGFYDDDMNEKEITKRFSKGLADTLELLNKRGKVEKNMTLDVDVYKVTSDGKTMMELRDTVIEAVQSGKIIDFNVKM